MDVEVLLQHRDIIRAPGEKNEVIATPALKALCRLGERRAHIHLLLGYTRQLGYVSMQLLKVLRLYYYLIRAADIHIFIELYSSYLYNLTAESAGKLTLYSERLLRISLIPLEVERYVIHLFILFGLSL